MRRRGPHPRTVARAGAFVTLLCGAAIVGQLGGVGAVLIPGKTATAPTASLTGIVEVAHGDNFRSGVSRTATYLTLDGQPGKRVELIGPNTFTLEPRSKVTVSGTLAGARLQVGKSTTLQRAAPLDLTKDAATVRGALGKANASSANVTAPQGPPTGGLRVAVIILDATDMPNALTADRAREVILTGTSSVARRIREASYGRADIASVDVHPGVPLGLPASSCASPSAPTQASRIAAADLGDYDYYVYVLPDTGNCWAGGWAYLMWRESWLIDLSRAERVVAHEIGHNFGLHHASSLRCSSGRGTLVSVSESCEMNHEYGDYADVMGMSGESVNFQNRSFLGWTDASQSTTVSATGTYRLRPVHLERGSPGTFANLVIPAPGVGPADDYTLGPDFGRCGAYSVDYQAAVGVDAALRDPGLRVRRVHTCSEWPRKTYVYNGKPWEGHGFSQGFGLGYSFEDLTRQISIKTVSADASEAVVQVTFGRDVSAPTRPSQPRTVSASSSLAQVQYHFDSQDDRHVDHYRLDVVNRGTSTTVRRDVSGVFRQGVTAVPLTRGKPAGISIVAVDVAGNTSPSAFAPVDTHPSATTKLAASTVGDRITLRWAAASDDAAGLRYTVKRGEAVIATTTSTSFSERVAKSGRSSYQVRAVDSKGQTSSWETVTITVDVSPPTVPSNLRVTAAWYSWIELAWAASTDDVGVTGYRIHRESDGALLAQVSARSWRHGSLPLNSGHRYYIRAIDAAGNVSGRTQTLSARTERDDPPSTPSNFRATNAWYSWIDLAWASSVDDVAVAAYLIHRASDDALLAQVSAAELSWRHGSLPVNSGHNYYVRAVDTVGNVSGRTETIFAQTERDNPPTTPANLRVSGTTGTSISLQWANSSDDREVAGYRVYRVSDGAMIAETTSSWWRHDGLPRTTTRNYFVRAVDKSGFLSGNSNNASGKTN